MCFSEASVVPQEHSLARNITRRETSRGANLHKGSASMEVLSSRVLLHPKDLECSLRFYSENLGLHIYREWGSGSNRGVVFFLGGGFLELSGPSHTTANENVDLWLQVRDVDAVGDVLTETGMDVIELPTDKPWGYARCRYETRMG